MVYDQKGRNILEEQLYIKGKKTGTWKRYYPNDKLEEVANYKANRLHGTFEKYQKNGQLAYKGNYLMNKRTGTWTYYSKNGNPESEEDYQSGVIVERRKIEE